MLKSDVQYVKGVGPKRALILKKIDIHTISDLLFHFPRGYEDRRTQTEKKEFEFIEADILSGRVVDYFELYTSSSLRIFKIIVLSSGKEFECLIFKRSTHRYDVFESVKKKIKKGAEVFLVGKAENDFFKPKFNVEEIYFDGDEELKINFNRIVPVYLLTSNIDNKTFRKIVFSALDQELDYITEIFPYDLLIKRNLLPRKNALKEIHFPEDASMLLRARQRFVYEELLLMALAWNFKKRETKSVKKNYSYTVNRNLLTPFKKNMGFEFTGSQKKAINEIFRDMQSSHPMTRLLAGDVGSGKTVVAISACLLAVENSHQCCFMAPTEILAEQHYITFKKFLSNLDIRYELLTSSTPKSKKRDIEKRLENGDIDILIGTHSVIGDNIKFKDLTLIVVDEQHRFGVRQRATLRQKGENIDMLVMTATPIPRTLFLALYGDLELSTLSDMPRDRKPVKTFHLLEADAFKRTKEYLKKGGQAYIVFPLIDESDKIEVKSLLVEVEKIKKEFYDYRVGIIYGRMKSSEKQKVMQDFLDKKIDILCATQVIEVGIDVPNACVMIIESAERFGIASLHQLRGRVGRGARESFCFLVSNVKSGDAYERIKAVCETTNGFELAQKDAYLRGVGEVLGVRQHGDMEFKIASVVRDKEILEQAMEDVDEIIKDDPLLLKKDYRLLRNLLNEIYGKNLKLIDLN